MTTGTLALHRPQSVAREGNPVIIKRLVRGLCPSGIDCPRVYELADGRLAIQGDKASPVLLAELGLPEGETLTIVPASLLPEVQ